MIPKLRHQFNEAFSATNYHSYLQELNDAGKNELDFRVAETPVFIPSELKKQMLEAGEYVLDFIGSDSFKNITNKSVPTQFKKCIQSEWPEMMVMDFGISRNTDGEIEAKLIELQGFPSLFAFEFYQDLLLRKHFNLPDTFSSYLNGYDAEAYIQLLKDIIIGDEKPENVILLELFPEKQKTRIDFELTKKLLGIPVVCVSNLIVESNSLYYLNEGIKMPVRRIYNRVIFDDWQQQYVTNGFDPSKDYEVEWIPNPQWYYRVSKFILPFLDNPFTPQTYFLNEVTSALPLNQYILKPLFSYAGLGVVMNPTMEIIDNIKDPENWILQEKITYADIIPTTDTHAKTEIRLFYFHHKNWERPKAVHNLARLSKGEMIGTRYNQDKQWVGGTIAYFE